jgi:hypothetical protein
MTRPPCIPPVPAAVAGMTLLLALSAGCHRSITPTPATRTTSGSHAGTALSQDEATSLPARIADFAGGPLVVDASATRRAYTRGRTRIEVTLARSAMDAAAYDRWVEASTAGFPQAMLGLPGDEANGFYQCTTGQRSSCDLLVQLRAGFHLEIRGAGTSSRDDLDVIARGLDLRALAMAP